MTKLYMYLGADADKEPSCSQEIVAAMTQMDKDLEALRRIYLYLKGEHLEN